MIKKIFASWIACFIVFSICSCSHDKTEPKYRIISAVRTANLATADFSISYNEKGKPAEMIQSGGTGYFHTVFSYDDNIINTVTTDMAGNSIGQKRVTINNAGKIINVKTTFYSNGIENWSNDQYIYDNNGFLLQSINTSSLSSTGSTNFTVSNGDVIATSDGLQLNYYEEKKYQPADYLGLINSLVSCGIENRFNNEHLVKSILYPGNTDVFNLYYNIDEKGLISDLTMSDGISSLTMSYQYESY